MRPIHSIIDCRNIHNEISSTGIFYRVISTNEYSQYIGTYTSYGIEATYADGTSAEIINDISVERAYVEMILELLNTCGVEAVHFRNVIEDFLN